MVAQYNETTRTTLQPSTTMPDDRCVQFFVTASKLNALVMYDYRAGSANVRLCTNETQDVFDKALGAGNFVDSLARATGGVCTFTSGVSLNRAASECVNGAGVTDCGAALRTNPAPYGAMWLYGISGPAEGAAACAVTVRAFDPPPPACSGTNVFVYAKTNDNVNALFLAALVAAVGRLIMEAFGLVSFYCSRGKNTGFFYSMAMDGVLGPINAMIIFVAAGCTKVPELPKPTFTWGEWATVLALDLLNSVAMPLAAVYGCTSLWLIGLAVAGLVKTIASVAIKMHSRCKGDGVVHSRDKDKGAAAVVTANPIQVSRSSASTSASSSAGAPKTKAVETA